MRERDLSCLSFPPLALDTRFPAGMTGLMQLLNIVVKGNVRID